MKRRLSQVSLKIWQPRYLTFPAIITAYPFLGRTLRSLTLDLIPYNSYYRSDCPTPPDSTELLALLADFVNLVDLNLSGSSDSINSVLTMVLNRTPKYNTLVLDSRPIEDRFVDEEDSEVEIDCFEMTDYHLYTSQWDKWTYDDGIAVNFAKNDSPSTDQQPTYSLSLFGLSPLDPQFLRAIQTLLISNLTIANFGYDTDLKSLLTSLISPNSLTHLSLFVFETSQDVEDMLLSFPNLTHLALGGQACPETRSFYRLLSTFKLEHLHCGRLAYVRVDKLIQLVEYGPKMLRTLRTLILDNIEFKVPTKEDWDGGYYLKDFKEPEWEDHCTAELVAKLKQVAGGKVSLPGRTIEALDFYECDEYQSALYRIEQEEEAEAEWEAGRAQREAERTDWADYRAKHDGYNCDCHSPRGRKQKRRRRRSLEYYQW